MDLRERNGRIIECRRCDRLVEWRERVALEKRRSFQEDLYWGKPVPDFGDPNADRLIVGLAPAAHGANRTGQMFTGDRSGDFLYRSLHKADVASLPRAERTADGLELRGVLITAMCHCAAPANKPTSGEIAECRSFLLEVLHCRKWQAIMCLGSMAWDAVHRGFELKPPKFAHLAESVAGQTRIVASYHPSQQNTFTGKLTETMLDEAVNRFLA